MENSDCDNSDIENSGFNRQNTVESIINDEITESVSFHKWCKFLHL